MWKLHRHRIPLTRAGTNQSRTLRALMKYEHTRWTPPCKGSGATPDAADATRNKSLLFGMFTSSTHETVRPLEVGNNGAYADADLTDERSMPRFSVYCHWASHAFNKARGGGQRNAAVSLRVRPGHASTNGRTREEKGYSSVGTSTTHRPAFHLLAPTATCM